MLESEAPYVTLTDTPHDKVVATHVLQKVSSVADMCWNSSVSSNDVRNVSFLPFEEGLGSGISAEPKWAARRRGR
jgi:hypothetical protein